MIYPAHFLAVICGIYKSWSSSTTKLLFHVNSSVELSSALGRGSSGLVEVENATYLQNLFSLPIEEQINWKSQNSSLGHIPV